MAEVTLAGLDGTFRLTRGQTFWLSTTHLCFAPLAPSPPEDAPLLPFHVEEGRMVSHCVFGPSASFGIGIGLGCRVPQFEVSVKPLQNQSKTYILISRKISKMNLSDPDFKRHREDQFTYQPAVGAWLRKDLLDVLD